MKGIVCKVLRETQLKEVNGIIRKIFKLKVTEAVVYKKSFTEGVKVKNYEEIMRVKNRQSIRFEIKDQDYISIFIDLRYHEIRISTDNESAMSKMQNKLGVDFNE